MALLRFYRQCCDGPRVQPLERDGLARLLAETIRAVIDAAQDANAPREWPAITTHNQGNHSVRTEKWRYIHYADGSEELYDEQADPNEWKNLAGDSNFAEVKEGLAKWLPKKDVPAAHPAPRTPRDGPDRPPAG